MNLRHVLRGTIALAAIGASQEATAADITRSSSDACVLSISGELVRGDYDRFTDLAKATYPDEVLESTAANTVCLNSPGGSLSEGVKFARHFYKEGFGTVQEELLRIWERRGVSIVIVTHDIEEALFLADRIVVMDSRPGRIVKTVSVDEPRPRDRNGDGLVELKRHLLSLLGSKH